MPAHREKKYWSIAPKAWCNMIRSYYIQLSYNPANYAKAFKQHNQLRLLAKLMCQITPYVLVLSTNAIKISVTILCQ